MAESFLEESVDLPDLRANPLMIALMCIIYRGEGSLPRDRAEVYGQCASLMFRRWDLRRRIHLELRAGMLIEPALRHLAWWLFSRGNAQPAVTEPELVDETAKFLHRPGFESVADARLAAEQFVAFCRGRMWVFIDVGTTVAGQPLYSFTHRTFLEYFAAAHLAHECDTPEQLARILAPRAARREWEVVGELAVQIKDHASNDGAQRVYTAMLSERRQRTVRGRSGVLQFLARCLMSVDPSPRTVRALTREILHHWNSGDADDPARALPLCWLLACCNRHRDIVSAEIDAQVSSLVGSDDPSISLRGVQLATFLPFAARHADGAPPASAIRAFWWDHTTRLLHEHSTVVAVAAAVDTGARFAALWWRIITMDEALSMPGGATTLFQHGSHGILGGWAAYLPNAVHRLYQAGNENQKRVTQLADDLASIGRYLVADPDPPWINGPIEDLRFYLKKDEPTDQGPVSFSLDELAYLGAAATILIIVESIKAPKTPIPDIWRTGPLANLYPYIEHRRKPVSRARLGDLPVPEPFRRTFQRWAARETNLIGQSQD